MYPIIFEFPAWVPFMGGEAVTSFGVFMLFSFLTGGYLIRAEMARIGEDPDKAWDLVFMGVVGGILGAKIYYILLNYPRLATDPAALILSRGGLVWYGGFILATALVVWEIRRQKLPLPTMADVVAPGLAMAYGVGRMGCFLVGDDWGVPTDSWVGIAFPKGYPATTVSNIEALGISVDPALVEKYGQVLPVHPTQLYEVGISTAVFFFLWKIRRHKHNAGWLFMLWLGFSGAERFLVEFLRAKDDRFFGVLTLAQIISLGIIGVGIYGMTKLGRPAEAAA
ncbi:MAG: prolipoprotein diacylglyceryl transferase [Gemmatimonadales bacterium]|jgi:phosphatidylglycerol:prolipoprotein diacylglycerol transferase|nr:prolipoprotein diacylglyceryl transferase [Gemmatimonadales bacterium]MBT3497418.1 prolipoprotein diacylglyceryl transferase [Gemmatimonadales bacterium]MBT3775897.1 prolipoprotein diacylglyceryl transferase [Gemmatimonadales bacterium]MBT3958428.1 prolipoprotein diacylglyceryl transferase [Gemmatimonadales bacterium]MBT4188312.1 prolipoprotein diacylglyceryl transferase [Gemmatimonadales bacterium]